MAFELYGMLAGSVSPMTGETIKPAYGGSDEAFLRKVVTPIYNTIAKVFLLHCSSKQQDFFFWENTFILFYFSAWTNRKLKGAKKSQNILSGETMMIWMSISGILFYCIWISILFCNVTDDLHGIAGQLIASGWAGQCALMLISSIFPLKNNGLM